MEAINNPNWELFSEDEYCVIYKARLKPHPLTQSRHRRGSEAESTKIGQHGIETINGTLVTPNDNMVEQFHFFRKPL